MALSTAWRSGLRAYQNPESGSTGNFSDRLDAYRILWAYYNNSTFERVADGVSWESYKGQYRLYPFIRSIYNPTKRLVQFYAGAIYPGVLAARKEDVQDGMQIAMPLVDGTDEAAVAIMTARLFVDEFIHDEAVWAYLDERDARVEAEVQL